MTRFFITRPILASVLSLIIVVAGVMATLNLPIAQYPQIAPPTVTITTTYNGANAETLSKTVASPIEEQLSGIDNLLYFSSSADSSGTLVITVTFDIGTNIDQATFNVSNRVNTALSRLPDEVRRNGIVVQKKSNDILLVVMLTSNDVRYSRLYLSNYATLNVLDQFKRVKGVGDALVFGGQDYAMRIWLQPDRMAQLGVTAADIVSAITAQNNQYAIGKIGQEPALPKQQLTLTVSARGRLIDPEAFGNIIIRAAGPKGMLLLKDVARVELGAQSYHVISALDGKPGVAIPIFLQSGANALETAQGIKDKMQELSKDFPKGMHYEIPYDTSDFVKATIQEVLKTFAEALALVVLVVFLFLQSWRATLIPMIAVPISIIGTCAGLYVLGFSINLLTLFAMILAIGIVVDDAIVVLENTERLMRDEHLPPFEAAAKSIQQVAAAVIAIVLVLCAVFVPVAFQGGIAGELFRQFAVTIAIAVVISGVVALTLTPMLCALILRETHRHSFGAAFFERFNHAFNGLTRIYTNGVHFMLLHRKFSAGVFLLVIVAVLALFKIVPNSFVPPEDQGYVITIVTMPDGATLNRTMRTTENVRQAIAKDASVAHAFAVNGFELLTGANKTNSATMFVRLVDWKEREKSATDVVQQLLKIGFSQADGLAFSVNPPSIRGLGSAGGFEVYVQSQRDADPLKLLAVVNNFIAELNKEPRLSGINTFFRPNVPQLFVAVDEAKALSQNVRIGDIYTALQSTMGSYYVNDFTKNGRTYRVMLQADAAYRMKSNDLSKIYVRSQPTLDNPQGNMIPLSALSTVKNIIGSEQLERYNGLIAAKIFGSGQNISSGQAIQLVEKIASNTLPDGYKLDWTAQAFQEKRTGNSALYAFVLAILMVFLILSAQFEAWSLPLAVIMAVPFAILGALGAVLLRDMSNDVYFQIGLITLIGLASKNAILIVEFANQQIAQGMDSMTAAIEAAKLRFRPIVMTSMAFVLGIIPLVFATGAGAAARRSMGTGVFGGMIIATFVATLFVPLFFIWLRGKRIKHHD